MPWLFVHWIRDITRFPEIHPIVHKAFFEGMFVVQYIGKKLSLITLDQSQKILKRNSKTKNVYT